jgi:hypothetical protein
METVEMRLLFVGGMLALGGVALVLAYGLARVMDIARSGWGVVSFGLAGRLQTSPVRHRVVTPVAYGRGRR